MDYSYKQRRHSRTSLSNYLKLAIEIYPLRNCPNPHCVDVLTLWPLVTGLTLSLSEYISNIQNYVAPPTGCQDSHVKTFMKQGVLPKGLYVRKPKTFVHLPYFEIHSLLNLFVPFPLPYTLACSKPQEHLNVTIEVDL